MNVRGRRHAALVLAMLAMQTTTLRAQHPPGSGDDPLASIPKLAALVNHPSSDLADVINYFTADQSSLNRRYDAAESPAQRQRMHAFYSGWRMRLRDADFEKLSQEGRVDYVLLDNYLTHQVALLDRQDKMRGEVAVLIPFADRLLALQDTRRNLSTIDPRASAATIAQVTKQIDSLRTLFEAPAGRGGNAGAAMAASDTGRPRASAPHVSKTVANRGADNVDQIRGVVTSWYRYYDGYDPIFSWWMRDPYRKIDDALTRYARTLRERVVGFRPADAQQVAAAGGAGGRGGAGGGGGGGGRGGAGGGNENNEGPIIGDPIGAEGLAADLVYEMIPYTPAELIAIAEREYAFSLSEVKKAAKEMGFGDNWKAAMEKVKNTYVEPGKQPELIRDLARQAEAFFDQHDWVTIPPLAREDWRMEMIDARAPARRSILPRRRTDPRVLSHGGHVGGGQAHESSWKQSILLARHGVSRAESRPPSSGFHERAVQHASPPVLDAVLERGPVALLGDVLVGPRVRRVAREPSRRAVLADASERAHHLLAQLPPREDDAGAGRAIPRGHGGLRARERRG
jgi:uncharacterized membrane protein YgcG